MQPSHCALAYLCRYWFYANGALSRVIIVQKLKPQAFTVLGWNANDIALAQASSLALCIVCLFLAHHSYA